jgi:hypothetical protein
MFLLAKEEMEEVWEPAKSMVWESGEQWMIIFYFSLFIREIIFPFEFAVDDNTFI